MKSVVTLYSALFENFTFAEKFAAIFSIAALGAMIIAAILVYVLTKKKSPNTLSTKDLTLGAAVIAISYALSFIGFTMPQGGTITPASSLPILVFCYFYGFKKSIPVVVAYMFLQMIQRPYIVHPMSAILDYVIPYLALILVSVFSYKPKKQIAASTVEGGYGIEKTNVFKTFFTNHYRFFIGVVLYMAVRYLSHVISGAVYWGEYAWDGWAVWPYSFAYNSFFLIDAAIAVFASAFLLTSKNFCRFMTVPTYTLKNSDTTQKNYQG